MEKKICMIAYTTYSTDARVRREAEAVASLSERSVSVLALKEKLEPRTYILDNVEVKELNVPKYRGKSAFKYIYSYLKFLTLAFLHCMGLLLKNSLDLVHIHNMPNFLIFAAILPRLSGVKVILDIHDTMIETYASKFSGFSSKLVGLGLRLEEWVCCKLASKIVCVNEIQRRVLINRGIPESKTIVLMNLPDPRRFRSGGGDRKTEGIRFKMVYFGTITKRLGVDLAIKAIQEIQTEVSGVEFYIFGAGEDREEFLELSIRLGLGAIVHFSEGSIPLDELISAIQGMDLVIVPNRRNAATELMLPVKMLEGMALGIPVIAPRLEAIEYYFNGHELFYFEPDDVQSLSAAILGAYRDKAGRDEKAENARKFFEKYAWETQKMDLINLYRLLTTRDNKIEV